MIHYKTKNKSFLQAQKELLEQGIKNNDFMLKLNDSSILNIENYDEIISTIPLQSITLTEAANNIWFLFREVITSNLIEYILRDTFIDVSNMNYKYILSPETLKLLYFYDNGYDLFIDLCRYDYNKQIIITECVNTLLLYESIFGFKNLRNICPITVGDKKRDELFYFMRTLEQKYYNSSLYFSVPELKIYEDILTKNIKDIIVDSRTKKFNIVTIDSDKEDSKKDVFFIFLTAKYSPDILANLLYDLKKKKKQIIFVNYVSDTFIRGESLQDVAFSLLLHKSEFSDFDSENIPRHKYIYI